MTVFLSSTTATASYGIRTFVAEEGAVLVLPAQKDKLP